MYRNKKLGEFRFRSLRDEDIAKIHDYQNSSQGFEISMFLDMDMEWIPGTEAKLKERIEDLNKSENNHIFGIWRDEDFIGMGVIYSDWDPLCPVVYVFIWPEFRRRGFGSSVANTFLDKMFNYYHGHKVSAGAVSYYEPGLRFIESLGFTKTGRMRRTSVHNGKYADWITYDIMKREWAEKHGGSF